jgi:hypothetical protein
VVVVVDATIAVVTPQVLAELVAEVLEALKAEEALLEHLV